jgi:hypothetical protein
MTWSYSGDPADGGVDEIRFLVQDTDAADQLITNEEIEYIIAVWTPVYGSPLMYASMVAEAIAAKFTREVAYSADGVSVGVEALQDKYNALAASLRDQYKQYDIGGGPDVYGVIFDQNSDPTIKPTLWAVGMHDNNRAGTQDRPTSYVNYEQGGDQGVPY